MNDKMTLIQYAIEKYEKEEELVEKLKNILSELRKYYHKK